MFLSFINQAIAESSVDIAELHLLKHVRRHIKNPTPETLAGCGSLKDTLVSLKSTGATSQTDLEKFIVAFPPETQKVLGDADTASTTTLPFYDPKSVKIRAAVNSFLNCLVTTGAVDPTVGLTLSADTKAALTKLAESSAFAGSLVASSALTPSAFGTVAQLCPSGKQWDATKKACDSVIINKFTLSLSGFSTGSFSCPTGTKSAAGSDGLGSCTYDPAQTLSVVDDSAAPTVSKKLSDVQTSVSGAVAKLAIVLGNTDKLSDFGLASAALGKVQAIACVPGSAATDPQYREAIASSSGPVMKSASDGGAVWVISKTDAASATDCDQYSVWLPAVAGSALTDPAGFAPMCAVCPGAGIAGTGDSAGFKVGGDAIAACTVSGEVIKTNADHTDCGCFAKA